MSTDDFVCFYFDKKKTMIFFQNMKTFFVRNFPWYICVKLVKNVQADFEKIEYLKNPAVSFIKTIIFENYIETIQV